MTIRFAFILCCVLGVAGCVAPSKLRVVTVPKHAGIPTVQKVKADGDVLRISVVQNSRGFYVAAIEPQVIEGDVYLSARCISSVVHATEFSVDFSGPKFPRDWRQRLYWIEEDAISSPINPSIEHVREIHRSKVILE